jgi:hypothetical protein
VKAGHHFENLHDENEDRAGEKVNLATGKPIKNSGPLESADMRLSVVKRGKENEDVLGKVEEEEDAAAKWLRENDPDYRKAA